MTDQPWGMSADEFIEGLEEIAETKEREEMLARIDVSFQKDYNGSRRRYADQVSTATALIARARSAQAERNGKG